VAKLINESQEASDWGVVFEKPKVNLQTLRQWKGGVVQSLAGGVETLCRRRGVTLLKARATFLDSQTLDLEYGDGDGKKDQPTKLRFENIILATGSRPAMPKAFDLGDSRVMDSTGALELEDVPQRLLVVGGGYIGLEMGTVYAALGSKVTVVEFTNGLLPGADRDLVKPLAARLAKHFDAVHLNTKVEALKATAKGVEATLSGSEINGTKKERFDRVLVSVGRRPNSGDLGLEKTSVEIDERGFVKIDSQQRTADPHILAIGDVAGEPMLAHKAAREGKIAAEILAGEPAAFDNVAIPAVVFTDPELAWCGLTEAEAKAEGREVEIARFPWAASGRAITLARPEGLTKIITEAKTERVLGVGIVGSGAGELIAEAVLAMEMGAVLRDIADTIHAHPTLSETVMESAEVGLGHSTHIWRPPKKVEAQS
jgi:dihydrolipoamide dehydrogenase